jgi:ketosteroid isomerase-like protein
MNTSDFSVFEKTADNKLSFEFPGVDRVEGVKRVILFFKILLRKYNNLTFTVSDVIVENEKACVVWTNKGEEKDGGVYENSGITLFHFIMIRFCILAIILRTLHLLITIKI